MRKQGRDKLPCRYRDEVSLRNWQIRNWKRPCAASKTIHKKPACFEVNERFGSYIWWLTTMQTGKTRCWDLKMEFLWWFLLHPENIAQKSQSKSPLKAKHFQANIVQKGFYSKKESPHRMTGASFVISLFPASLFLSICLYPSSPPPSFYPNKRRIHHSLSLDDKVSGMSFLPFLRP